jgi:hypothetical protein
VLGGGWIERALSRSEQAGSARPGAEPASAVAELARERHG